MARESLEFVRGSSRHSTELDSIGPKLTSSGLGACSRLELK